MRNLPFLIFTLFFFSLPSLSAQINGNGKKITKTFPAADLRDLQINLTATIKIDPTATPGITITTDENIIRFINVEVENGKLDLTQLEWIEPQGQHEVIINAPKLTSVNCDAHSKVDMVKLNKDYFKVEADVGKLMLSGAVKELDVRIKLAQLQAEDLDSETVNIQIDGWGKAKLGSVNTLNAQVGEKGAITVKNKPAKLEGNAEIALERGERPVDSDLRFIDFKIKNNSKDRQQLFVEGPKADGTYFGYGFPMNPGQVRDKTWTPGSKVYQVNWRGKRSLLLTIKGDDENKMVNLFDQEEK